MVTGSRGGAGAHQVQDILKPREAGRIKHAENMSVALSRSAPVVVTPACTQVVDAYGRVATVCR
jgi:hypothetical protein